MVCQNLKNNRVGVIDLNNIFLKITDLPVKRVKFTTEKPDRNRLISVAIVSINKSSTDFNFCFFSVHAFDGCKLMKFGCLRFCNRFFDFDFSVLAFR